MKASDFFEIDSELDLNQLPFADDPDFLALTLKQKRFLFAYAIKGVKNWTLADCARFAVGQWDWSDTNSATAAFRWKSKLIPGKFFRLADDFALQRLGVTIENILREETNIAFSDIGDYIDDQGFIKNGAQLKELPAHVRRAIASLEIIETPIGPKTKVSLWDKGSSLSRLQKAKGIGTTSRLEVTGKDGGPIEVAPKFDLSDLSNKELEVLLKLSEKVNAGSGEAEGSEA